MVSDMFNPNEHFGGRGSKDLELVHGQSVRAYTVMLRTAAEPSTKRNILWPNFLACTRRLYLRHSDAEESSVKPKGPVGVILMST